MRRGAAPRPSVESSRKSIQYCYFGNFTVSKKMEFRGQRPDVCFYQCVGWAMRFVLSPLLN